MSVHEPQPMPGTDAPSAAPDPNDQPMLIERLVQKLPGMKGVSDRQKIITAVKGSAWTISGFGAGQLLRFVSTLVIARLLTTPEAFGLIALVNVFLTGLEMFAEIGVQTSVVQNKRGDEPSFLGTAFSIQAIRGLLLGLIAVGCAYPFAIFYDTPELAALTMAGGLNLVLRGLVSPSILTMTRHVRLAPITMLTVGSEIVGVIVSIVWAFQNPSAWAIIGGTLAASFTYMAASHIVGRGAPGFRWEGSSVRELIVFGGWIFFATATAFLGNQAEQLALGKFVSMEELGCFSIALMISAMPRKLFMRVIGGVFFPMISATHRSCALRAVSQYSRCKWLFLAGSIPLCAFFVYAGPLLVSLLFPDGFEAAGWMLQLLGIRTAMAIVGAPTASMLLALGAARYSAAGNTAGLIFIAGGLALAFGFGGIHEALWVLTLAPFAIWTVSALGLIRIQKLLGPVEFGSMAAFIAAAAAIYASYALLM